MGRLRMGPLSVFVAVVIAAAGCAGSSPGSAGGGNGGGAPASVAGVPAGGGGANAGGGDLSKVDACALLTPAELKQVLGVAFSAGVNQDSDQVKQCEWDEAGASQNLTVGLDVRAFDPGEWQTVSEFPHAVSLPGLGEAAYKGSPLQGDLSVKASGFEIDLGIANFSTKTAAEIDEANLALMKLILPRL